MTKPSARPALRIYATVFGVDTEAERASILRRCMTDDVEVVFPSGYRAAGPDQVAHLMTSEAEGRSPTELERDDNPTWTGSGRRPNSDEVELSHDFGDWLFESWGFQEAHGYFRYNFSITLKNGTVTGGTDFGQVDDTGKICRLIVFPGQ